MECKNLSAMLLFYHYIYMYATYGISSVNFQNIPRSLDVIRNEMIFRICYQYHDETILLNAAEDFFNQAHLN